MISIKSAIPKTGKKKIKSHSEPIQDEKLIRSNEPHTKISTGIKSLQKISIKQITNKLLINTIKPPTSIETWINIFPFLETEDWNSIFLRTFEITKETYLQSFQYKILNRILYCKDKLFKCKIKTQ